MKQEQLPSFQKHDQHQRLGHPIEEDKVFLSCLGGEIVNIHKLNVP